MLGRFPSVSIPIHYLLSCFVAIQCELLGPTLKEYQLLEIRHAPATSRRLKMVY
jgi:hypothetical protein